jgi:hypothetical protein
LCREALCLRVQGLVHGRALTRPDCTCLLGLLPTYGWELEGPNASEMTVNQLYSAPLFSASHR